MKYLRQHQPGVLTNHSDGSTGPLGDSGPGSGGGRTTSSTKGTVMAFLIGLSFVGAGFLASPAEIEDEAVTEGTVVEVQTRLDRTSSGSTRRKKEMHSPIYEYEVDGARYTLNSDMSSSRKPTIGSTVQIAYSESDPNNAYRADGWERYFPWIFIGTGGFLVLLALGNMMGVVTLGTGTAVGMVTVLVGTGCGQ